MGYRMIQTTTLFGRKRVRMKSTGHNGDHDPEQRERKMQAAQIQFTEAHKPRHLPRAGS